ncbi:MAG: hypothetical protein EOO38_08155 [Cytophagaceae bacterium]|nr:MAG: hypothetical protein EOO38_08155 [Cytophagaceae bacterium]
MTTTATFPQLESLTQPAVSTEQAAFYLNRRPQTLRCWACLENGPIPCMRVHGRLAWPVAGIKALLGVA